MRHTARKVKKAIFSSRPRSRAGNGLSYLNSKITKVHPIRLMKKNPYSSLGVALGLSALGGMAVWFFNHKR